MKFNLTERTAKILLVTVIAARATSFCFSKMCLQQLSPFSLLGFRFTLAFLLLCALFLRQIKATFTVSDLLKGILFGSIYFLVMICEYTGLPATNSSTASFIENMAIVIVPFLNIPLTHRLPTRKNILCVLFAIVGVGLLTLTSDGFSLTVGELYLIDAAFFYATAIIVTNSLSKHGNPLNMGIFQVGTIGLLGLFTATISGSLSLPNTPEVYLFILILAVVCTGFGYTLQPVAQSKLSAETSSLFCAVNPLVASLIGIFFMHEIPSLLNIVGEFLIILVLVLS